MLASVRSLFRFDDSPAFPFLPGQPKICPGKYRYITRSTCPADDFRKKLVWIPGLATLAHAKKKNGEARAESPFAGFSIQPVTCNDCSGCHYCTASVMAIKPF